MRMSAHFWNSSKSVTKVLVLTIEVPSTTNPLGMRGGSEGGITPGLAAVANAVVDALAEFGVEHIELPATPERVWNAIRSARRDAAEVNRPAAKLTSLASACRHALSVS